MKRPVAALVAVLAATAVGCGASTASSQNFTAAQEDVADVVEDLQTAAQNDEATRICTEIFSTQLSRRLGNRCTATVQTAIDDTDIFEIDAERVRITGERARVRIDAGRDDEQHEELDMVREQRGGWRIAGLGRLVR